MPSPVTREQVWVNVAPAHKCWRLVYNSISKKVYILFEKEGPTKTMQSLFCSSRTDGRPGSVTSLEGRQECLDVVKRLGLNLPDRAVIESEAVSS